MNWIQNISFADVIKGQHFDVGHNSMLIQICDPGTDFPTPKHTFKEVHQFHFLDIDEKDDKFACTQEHANELVKLLQHALDNRMNVIVHCHAGICRSGAVAEVGIMMGFIDTEAFRMPNLVVKHRMMKALGCTYDENENHTANLPIIDFD